MDCWIGMIYWLAGQWYRQGNEDPPGDRSRYERSEVVELQGKETLKGRRGWVSQDKGEEG
jgi:hypothetical protein